MYSEFMYPSVESKKEEKARWGAIGNGKPIECGCPYCYCPNTVQGQDICPACVEKQHPQKFRENMARLHEAQRRAMQDEY